MIRKSRFAVTIGLVMALSVAAIAYADGVSENDPGVKGKVSPTKLDKKKFKPVSLLSGVFTAGPVPGLNPEAEFLSYPKNLKFDSTAAPFCSAPIEFQTTEAAKQACPADSNIGSGVAEVRLPGGFISDPITVTVFNGPNENEVRLHTYSQQLEGATPTVFGKIVKSGKGSEFGEALSVPDAPDVADDSGKITKFEATITKASRVVLARCKDKTQTFQREVTYDDGTKESVQITDKCKRKSRR